jgi:hypothetical protein
VLNIIKLTSKLVVRTVNFSINYNGNKGFRLLSLYERLNKGETVDKAQDIYRYFREEYAVYGQIFKPTGPLKEKEFITLKDRYEFFWRPIYDNGKYYVIEV